MRDRESKNRRLRELAREASERLDMVLREGESTRTVERLIGVSGRESPEHRPERGGSLSGRSGNGVVRDAGRGRVRAARALVSHVSPGMAMALSNLLKHMGLATTVASSPEDLEGDPSSRNWDIVLVQGSPMPWPGMKLIAATLRRWAGSEVPLVLLTRPGERLIPEAAGLSVSRTIEWPFQEEKVRRAISDLLRSGRPS